MNTTFEAPSTRLETESQKMPREIEFSKITQALLGLLSKRITPEELFGHRKFSPEQEKAASVLGMGKRFASISKKIYDDVLNPDAKYVSGN